MPECPACLDKKLDAMVTGPIHKEAAQLAGIGVPGHTEYLASLCRVAEVRMLLVVRPPPGDPRHHPPGPSPGLG